MGAGNRLAWHTLRPEVSRDSVVSMDPAVVAQRFLGSGKPATAERINKIPRLIDSNEDFQAFLALLPADVAVTVQQAAITDRWSDRFGWA